LKTVIPECSDPTFALWVLVSATLFGIVPLLVTFDIAIRQHLWEVFFQQVRALEIERRAELEV
jgi:hypothetical protein